jgi:hypothetical protein
MTSESTRADLRRRRASGAGSHARLWLGVLLPLVNWLSMLGFGYALTDWVARHELEWPLKALMLGGVIAGLALVALAVLNLRHARSEHEGSSEERLAAAVMLARIGILSSLIGLLLVLSLIVPIVILHPRDP